ncbi:putative leucine-rich repeat receptor-like protein kinase [Planoprotostelium fungivorum]|uniref:Putative leucine-rich repeat receptor-like protein kinase n=1 Tax=Planoprotostelium fungivorum TaxID=1890364 RepID=A0A2P6NYT3_9EUKA|nr:putative leucine-rich repeat receptor-like protein kinase [Planoprotostelium fungivorum]
MFFGVNCTDGFVTSLSLPSNKLVGQLNLTHLDLSLNQLSGTIPASLGQLIHLEYLDLNGNKLTGIIPDMFGMMNELTDLYLYNNALYGPIPSSLSKVEHFELNRNTFLNGSIPVSIGNFNRLETLYLDYASISGSLPTSICNLTQLTVLSINCNRFSGTIPACFSQLVNLNYFLVWNNSFTGGLPDMGMAKSMLWFDASSNYFSGNVPPGLLNIPTLTLLGVQHNFLRFTGEIPSSWSNMVNATYIDLSSNRLSEKMSQTSRYNYFSGNLPDVFHHSITTFNVVYNYFSGPIPPSAFLNPNITRLIICKNSLTGTIPEDIIGMKRLTSLYLYQNLFEGPLPQALGNLTRLVDVQLWQNQFNGSIPASIGSLKSIKWLYLSDNQLTGAIPTELGNLSTLTYFGIDTNNLTGVVPSSFSQLKNLATFYASSNPLLGGTLDFLNGLNKLTVIDVARCNFYGSIPLSVINMTKLNNFWADENQFTGVLPDFSPLANISGITVSHNNLSGLMPSKLGGDLRSLDLSYNSFGGYIRSEWSAYRNLTWVQLNDNQIGNAGDGIHDNYLSVLWSLPNLVRFDVSNNLLKGELWSDWLDYSYSMQTLSLSNNRLSGPLNINRYSAPLNLQSIDVSLNEFYGRTPEFLSVCSYLTNINISHNQFDDIFPFWWSKLTRLNSLDVSYNRLYGPLPSAISRFPNLRVLKLSDNRLYGQVPLQMGELRLQELDCSNNLLMTDSLEFLSPMDTLQLLNMSNNYISSLMPSSLSPLLEVLDLSNNPIYGPLSSSVYGLRNLQTLNLQGCRLNGTVRRFQGDPKVFDISHNELTGDVSFLSQLSSIATLRLNNNQFDGVMTSMQGRKNLLYIDISENRLRGQLPDFTQLLSLSYFNGSDNMFNGSVPSFADDDNLMTLDLSRNFITTARGQVELPANITCNLGNNPLFCPISWMYYTQCQTRCTVRSTNDSSLLVYHMEGELMQFNGTKFSRVLAELINITESRIEIYSVRIAAAAVDSVNEGSIADTEQVMREMTVTQYKTGGIPLISAVGSIVCNDSQVPQYDTDGKLFCTLRDPVTTAMTSSLVISTYDILDTRGNSLSSSQVAGVVLGPIIFSILLVSIFTIWRRRVYQKRQRLTYLNAEMQRLSLTDLMLSDVTVDRVIASGHFGQVYKGNWNETVVAMKSLKKTEQSDDVKWREEIILLKRLNHPNVVRLLGVAVHEEQLMMVMEYVSFGSLDTSDLTDNDLVRWCFDIVKGMIYLQSKGIIHRDLAARNVLVDSSKQLKISDFGMSRQTEEMTYESTEKAMPFRWCAPEMIHYKISSHESDVWSFAVLAWEIFTLGRIPYWELSSNADVIEFVVEKKGMLDQPHRCWRYDSKSRIDFRGIYHRMKHLYAGHLAEEDTPDVTHEGTSSGMVDTPTVHYDGSQYDGRETARYDGRKIVLYNAVTT